jgi:hypothetical protein
MKDVDYVRVPWQLYLLSCTALTSPLRLVFNRHIRRMLMDGIAALTDPGCSTSRPS